MKKAFVLGAGLGTRLKQLTAVYPKPLIPVRNRPLISWAFDHLVNAGVEEFIVNTHHLPHRYEEVFPDSTYLGRPIHFVHEQERLETGGGIANIADLVRDESFIVYNGDVLTDLPLRPLLDAHEASGNLVTLVLRSQGPNCNVSWNPETGKVIDLRGALGTNGDAPKYQFTGIYAVHPDFLDYVQVRQESVVPAWLRVIQERDGIGAIVADEGQWWDLGCRDSYLEASAMLEGLTFPDFEGAVATPRIDAKADIDPTAVVDSISSLGAVRIGSGARIENSILWSGAEVEDGALLKNCIVTGAHGPVHGEHSGMDL